MATQYGLCWSEDTLGFMQPLWTVEPSIPAIEQIVRKELRLNDAETCLVEFYAQGGFNKLYSITTDTGRWLMRVALPVDPGRKTASEVATMQFVRKNTSIPVPEVVAYEASNENELKFEWMLVQFTPGVVLEKYWRKLSMQQKEDLVRKLARYQAELFSMSSSRFQSIGNLYRDEESYDLGSIVSMFFFWKLTRGPQEDEPSTSNRGPFPHSYAWLQTRLQRILSTREHIIATINASSSEEPDSDEEEAREDSQRVSSLATRLLALLPTIFPPDEPPNPTILFHDDLHANNILVDPKTGAITAVLDWECVSFLPKWMACQPPALLSGKSRTEEPLKDIYSAYDPEVDDDENGECIREYNEDVSSLFWEHKLEYERGVFRDVFLKEMKMLQPEWIEQYTNGEAKRDFELAGMYCDGEFTIKRVEMWLHDWEKEGRRMYSLREELEA